MPDRDEPKSRWSSVSERQEREKQRAAAREEAKRARLASEAAAANPTESAASKRRLTDEERRTIREFRFPGAADRVPSESTRDPRADQPAAEEEPAATASSLRRSSPSIGTKWRDSVAASGGAGGPGLPDLPGDAGRSGGRKRPGNARLLIFGVGLFAVMAVVAFLPFGPFAEDEPPAVPTASAPLPSILDPQPGDDDDASEPRQQPVAGADQAVVCIDPGHGGWDTGWNRSDQGDNPSSPPIVTESELNLGMAYMLKAELEAQGIFVVLTRPSGAAANRFDEDINGDGETRLNAENPEQAGDRDELQARINVCNEAGTDVLISVHINGFDDVSANGYEVIYTAEREFGERNEELATLVYRRLDQAMRNAEHPGQPRGARPDTDIDNEHFEFGGGDHFLMTGPAAEDASIVPSEMPGVIVEPGFLSNDADAIWLVQPGNQQIVVEAYALGIVDYLDRNPPGS